jgi:tRNA-2-methylthio-N6-dimethylallyladenosine synthase
MSRTFFIETLGCQMNVLDSELIASGLVDRGYTPAETAREADVLLFNTCSVRQHAEDKVYSALGRLKHAKKYNPLKVIGVLGCMAQKDGTLIFRRAPQVDLVVGPSQLGRLPQLIDEVAAGAEPVIAVSTDRKLESHREARESFAPFNPARRVETRHAAHQAMVRVAFGCDNFCTYCIVPSVRGPDQSRPIERIEQEVILLARQAVDNGVALEVTLLGQTVNSYRYNDGERTYRLADVLRRLNPIEGLSRLKFVTNHPRHMRQDLLDAVRDLDKVAPYLHVPAQSGADRILKRMRRGYTSGEYREMLGRIHETVPGAAVTSDFIVGFCGETEAEFLETVELVREARFKNSFIFKYSPRPGTYAAEHFDDDVPEEEKRRRNNELLAVQNAISEEDNLPLVGKTVKILVEGPSKTSVKHDATGDVIQLVGRTVCDRIIVFDGTQELVGQIVPVVVEKAKPFTLFGRQA